MPEPGKPARLAIDIGGTFTDVVLELGSGARVTTKLLTTYAHPGEAVLVGIDDVMNRAGANPADVGLIIRGTSGVGRSILMSYCSKRSSCAISSASR